MAALVSKQITVIVSFAVLNLLAFIAMGLRFYSMKVVLRKIKVHDALCIVSLVMLIAYSIVLLIGKCHHAYNYSGFKTKDSNRHDRWWHWTPHWSTFDARDGANAGDWIEGMAFNNFQRIGGNLTDLLGMNRHFFHHNSSGLSLLPVSDLLSWTFMSKPFPPKSSVSLPTVP
jgi:hypothetical protein